jgi:hypothetical protein
VGHKWGYWTDLQSRLFGEGAVTNTDGTVSVWIQAMPLGDYTHPVYGDIKITPERVQAFATGVNEKVRGTDLDIDYDHKEYNGEAAGWVQQAESRTDGLWLLVNWTKKAYSLLKDKAYRYFSPEFSEEWTHPKTQVVHKNVLFGGAITNRPFLKDILPINMSELIKGAAATPPPVSPNNNPPTGGGRMDPKLLRAILGLAESATDEQVSTKLAEMVRKNNETPTPPVPPTGPAVPPPLKFDINDPQSVQDALKQLADVSGNPAIKTLTDLVKAQGEQLVQMRERERVLKVNKMLDDLDAGQKFTVPPAVKDQLREMLLKAPDGLGEQVYNAYRDTLNIGLIDMTEKGWQRRHGEQSPTAQILTEIDKLMAGNKDMTYAEAAQRVSRENPQLASEYRADSYIPSEGR